VSNGKRVDEIDRKVLEGSIQRDVLCVKGGGRERERERERVI
jgi:hypothetical protein